MKSGLILSANRSEVKARSMKWEFLVESLNVFLDTVLWEDAFVKQTHEKMFCWEEAHGVFLEVAWCKGMWSLVKQTLKRACDVGKHICILNKQGTVLLYWFVLLSLLIFACHAVERNAPKNFCGIPAASGSFYLLVQIGIAFQILLDQVGAPDLCILFS